MKRGGARDAHASRAPPLPQHRSAANLFVTSRTVEISRILILLFIGRF